MAKVAVLFPGQGSQTVGMAKETVEKLPQARRLFEKAADVLGFDLYKVCVEGPVEQLNSTVVSQPAIFTASLAALERLRDEHPEVEANCTATAGLSLGEYTALVFAGAMTFTDGLHVVKRRGEAMQQASDAVPTGMVSILGAEPEKVEQLCSEASSAGTIQIANYLCPKNIVVSGANEACAKLEEIASDAGFKTVRLAVAGAFHTDFMRPADEALADALSRVELGSADIPVWSNVDAQPHTEPDEVRPLLVKQVLQPVLWERTMRNLLAEGIEEFWEVGPGRVLCGLLKRVDRKVPSRSIQ